jgi:hypothetical protein
MTFPYSHFYTGLVLETYIHFMTTVIYNRNNSTFGVNDHKNFQKLCRFLITITCPKNTNKNIYTLSLQCVYIISPKLPIKD